MSIKGEAINHGKFFSMLPRRHGEISESSNEHCDAHLVKLSFKNLSFRFRDHCKMLALSVLGSEFFRHKVNHQAGGRKETQHKAKQGVY